MTPEELRADTPALAATTYLNTGASGVAPRRVVEAGCAAVRDHEFEAPATDGMYPRAESELAATRTAVAEHLGAAPGSVALTTSTGDGLGRVFGAIDWEPGDVAVRTDVEHPATDLPLERAARHDGVDLRTVPTDRGRIDRGAVADAVADARLVTFSAVDWVAGTRADVRDLVELAHDAGARVVVDAVQWVGQRRLDVTDWGADAVLASGHKWVMGDWGAGFAVLDPGFAETLSPPAPGYLGVENPMAEAPYRLRDGARRLEGGTVSPGPYATLREGLAVLEELGMETVETRIERLADRLRDGLADRHLYSPPTHHSGLVTLQVRDAEAAVEALAERDVRVRSVPGPELLRVSLHVYNTPADVDALLAGIEAVDAASPPA